MAAVVETKSLLWRIKEGRGSVQAIVGSGAVAVKKGATSWGSWIKVRPGSWIILGNRTPM